MMSPFSRYTACGSSLLQKLWKLFIYQPTLRHISLHNHLHVHFRGKSKYYTCAAYTVYY